MSHGLNKIDPRYVDGSRGRNSQVLRITGDNLDTDFGDLLRVGAPTGTTGNNGTYYFNNSQEFHTFILNHNNSNIYLSGDPDVKTSYQVRVYNHSGNGNLTVQEFEKFAWQGQKPPATVTVPSGNHYVYGVTYHGNYASSYPNLKDWSAIFVSESP
jgi:hypothetical protein|tara:strand:- start:731 stop:1198 length:468 start_codon:yes stop_codon:yes gene_type:complete